MVTVSSAFAFFATTRSGGTGTAGGSRENVLPCKSRDLEESSSEWQMCFTGAIYTVERPSSHVCNSSTLLLVCEDLASYQNRSDLGCLCSLSSLTMTGMFCSLK